MFPDAISILRNKIEDPPYPKLAISIFENWLGSENIDQLDCDDQERKLRNRRLLKHWEKIFDETQVFGLTHHNQVSQLTNKHEYLQRCSYSKDKVANDFQWIIIPAFKSIYHEHWDDTNVLWYQDRELADQLVRWGNDVGLHAIEYG